VNASFNVDLLYASEERRWWEKSSRTKRMLFLYSCMYTRERRNPDPPGGTCEM